MLDREKEIDDLVIGVDGILAVPARDDIESLDNFSEKQTAL